MKNTITKHIHLYKGSHVEPEGRKFTNYNYYYNYVNSFYHYCYYYYY